MTRDRLTPARRSAAVFLRRKLRSRMRALLLLLPGLALGAVESGPCQVLFVGDGDTIGVRLPGEPAVEATVRLKWIDAPERHDNPHGAAMPEGESAVVFLKALLPKGARVALWSPGEDWERDEGGRIIALVRYRTEDAGDDPAAWPTAQEAILRAGWSVYWRRYGDAPEPLRRRFAEAEAAARTTEAGAWASAGDWMRAKR
jgi:endonuclease YncB( thermonuclease family)